MRGRGLLAAVGATQALDLATFAVMVGVFGTQAEANPFAVWLVGAGGIAAVVLAKALGAAGIIAILDVLRWPRPLALPVVLVGALCVASNLVAFLP